MSGMEEELGPANYGSKSAKGFPSHPSPLSLPHLPPMDKQNPDLRVLEGFLPLASYLSQFQEHKDIPINVHHHLRCFHQPGHRVLLCDTHSQESAEESAQTTEVGMHSRTPHHKGPSPSKERSGPGASSNRPGKATGD